MAFLRLFIVGVVVAGCLAGPAYAQRQQQKQDKSALQLEDEQKKKDADAIDRQYRSTLDRVRKNTDTTENRPVDPWQNMRSPSDSNSKR